MSDVPATFGDVFVQACRAKNGSASGGDVAIVDNALSAFTLVTCGRGANAFAMSSKGLTFKDVAGREVEYTWEQLDFVLPGDLSLAADKLKATTDLHEPSERIARATGRICAYAAVTWLVYLVVTTVIGGLWDGYWTMHHALWYFGDAIFFGLLVVVIGGLAPFVIPIVIGVFATGGLVAAIGLWLGRLVYLPVRLLLYMVVRDFPNSIAILDARWVKMPWGTPTTQLLDFVMLGVKLRRRGLG